MKNHANSFLLITAFLSLGAFGLNAQSVSENYAGLLSSYLGQGSANGTQAVKNNSCVPTSTANGLSYLEFYQLSIGNADPFTVTPNNVTAINALQTAQSVGPTGTSAANAIAGLNSYISPTGANPAPTVATSQVYDPTAGYLGTGLGANDAIQLGILWGAINGGTFTPVNGGGGHFVSLTGMNMNNGTGTMTILDPWGDGSSDPNAGTQGAFISLNVTTVNLTGVGNVLYVTYTANPPDDTTGVDGTGATSYGIAGQTGYIAVDDLEAVVPEPSTFALIGAGAIGLLAKLRRKA